MNATEPIGSRHLEVGQAHILGDAKAEPGKARLDQAGRTGTDDRLGLPFFPPGGHSVFIVRGSHESRYEVTGFRRIAGHQIGRVGMALGAGIN